MVGSIHHLRHREPAKRIEACGCHNKFSAITMRLWPNRKLNRMLIACLLTGLAQPVSWADDHETSYNVHFSGKFHPEAGYFAAQISVDQPTQRLVLLDFAAPAKRFSHFTINSPHHQVIIDATENDGNSPPEADLLRQGNRVIWRIPAAGGSISYRVKVDHLRDGKFDARMTSEWALLRLDDLFPPARARSLVGARSESTLKLSGPRSWTIESRYGPVTGQMAVDDPDRRFDRPTGWLIAGQLGIRRDTVAERKISLAAPRNQGFRRLDTLAFIRWTLPRLVKIFTIFPDRLLIVSALDDMWRGGLSGPSSLYLHADRPLISENATSTLLHELVHVAMAQSPGNAPDWIVEGLAEYYSLEILRRSGGISQQRYQQSFEKLLEWADEDKGKLKSPSTGPDTARAAILFHRLNRNLEKNTAGSLDSVVRQLVEADEQDFATLLHIVDKIDSKSAAKLDQFVKKYNDDSH